MTTEIAIDEIPIDHELIAKAKTLLEAIETGAIDPTVEIDTILDIGIRVIAQPMEFQTFMIENQELFPDYCLQEAGWRCGVDSRDATEHEIFVMWQKLSAKFRHFFM